MINDSHNESKNKGQWTRQGWNNPEKRSVVDYILTTKYITNNTTTRVIDKEEAFKIKTKDGTATDHSTIIMNIKINNPRRKTFKERWKTNNKEGWEKFNTEIQRANQTNQLAKKKYEEIEKILTQTLKESIRIQKVRTDKPRKPTSKTIKCTKKQRKKAKEDFTEACKNGSEEQKTVTLDKYIKSQKHYRDAIEEEEKIRTNERIENVINGTKKRPKHDMASKEKSENQQ